MGEQMMKGLYKKYHIQKSDGSSVDSKAEYIVLRIDSGEYVHACRAGVMAFARAVRPVNPILAADLKKELMKYPMGHAMVPEGWTIPQKECPDCGAQMTPVAVHDGEGWGLFFECLDETGCGRQDDEDQIEWPFVVDWVSGSDLEAAGFIVV